MLAQLTGTLGERIIRRRRQLGISQDRLAKDAGVLPGRMSEYENGKRTPQLEILHRIATALDLRVGDLVD